MKLIVPGIFTKKGRGQKAEGGREEYNSSSAIRFRASKFIYGDHSCLLPSYFCLLNTLFLLNPGQAHALQTRTVYSQDAQGIQGAGVELKVWSGYGLTINFIPANEIIKEVWIGDPTHFVFSSNGDLCQKNDLNEGDSCQNSPKDATVLFIRQIKKIDFPNVLSSQDGSTQLTIITESTAGQKQYQFRLGLASGEPAYTSLIIKSDSEKLAPFLFRKKQQSTSFKSDADIATRGLAIATLKREIKQGSVLWHDAQLAIQQLRYGKSMEDAISLTGVPTSVFEQLIRWGQAEP